MAGIEGRAQLHIKEDCIITLITTKDAITDIIALLVLILFCTLTKVEQRKKEEFFFAVFFVSMWTVAILYLKMLREQLVLNLKLGRHSFDLLSKVNIFNKSRS